MAIGLKTSAGGNITVFSAPVVPDRNFGRERTPRVRVTKFGDGYEQRKVVGINNIEETYSLAFVNRPNTEIDDLNTFFESLNGVTSLLYTIEDTNAAGSELDIKVVCESWSVTAVNTSTKSLSVSLRRVYEA